MGSSKNLNFREYPQRMLLALAEAHLDPESAGVRAHGFPGALIAMEAGIITPEQFDEDYWTSRVQWNIVAALREMRGRGWIEVIDKDGVHPDSWGYILTPQGLDYALGLMQPWYRKLIYSLWEKGKEIVPSFILDLIRRLIA